LEASVRWDFVTGIVNMFLTRVLGIPFYLSV
jgi:hypothetical protein